MTRWSARGADLHPSILAPLSNDCLHNRPVIAASQSEPPERRRGRTVKEGTLLNTEGVHPSDEAHRTETGDPREDGYACTSVSPGGVRKSGTDESGQTHDETERGAEAGRGEL